MPHHILIVNQTLATGLQHEKVLKKHGHTTTHAANATAALAELKKLRDNNINPVMLIDKDLPGKDGMKLTQEIRRNTPYHDTAIVTTSASVNDEKAAIAAGADAHVEIPPSSLLKLQGALASAANFRKATFIAPPARTP